MGLYSGVIMLQLFWLALVLLHGSFTPVSMVVVKSEVVSGSSEKVEIVLNIGITRIQQSTAPQSQRNGLGRFREIYIFVSLVTLLVET